MNNQLLTITICCPGNVISGGVNSLHNLCRSLIDNNYNASMYYVNPNEATLKHPQIATYNAPRTLQLTDSANTLVIVPETMVPLITSLRHAKKMVYWLGLNYFFKNPTWRFPFNIKLIRKLISCRSYTGFSSGNIENVKRRLNEYAKSHLNIWNSSIIHLSNSHFVADYCRRKGASNVFVLHNPIRDEFYNHTPTAQREKIILFGPKTPNRILKKTRKKLSDFQIIRLKKMPLTEVFELMSKAMIFAEFGNYSGRDRMPREAAMLGCIVFMNTRGSAAFSEDYDIPAYFRIADSKSNHNLIVDRIGYCTQNYKNQLEKIEPFIKQLINERTNFDKRTKDILSYIIKNN
jgi:hypothetical protein